MRLASPRATTVAVTGLVAAAALLLFVAGRAIPTPWILIDELLHAELARGLRTGAGYDVRGHGLNVSWTYPALLAPFAWSYGAMKAVNAVVIALTAVPVFLWARRLVSDLSALAAAVLTLLLPSLLFSSTLMLESLFLPLFVAACFLIALALERPTPGLQLAALVAIASASATRVQGLILVPVVVLCALTLRRVRELAPTLAVCAVVSLAVVVKLAAGGLGVYAGTRSAHYAAGPIAGWLVRNAGELSLAVGIVPVAALLALRARTLRERAFVAVVGWTTAALVALASVSASWQPPGLKERYMLEAMPLLLVALVVWLERGAPRPWWAVLVPAALAVALPLHRLFGEQSLLGNAWALLPFDRAGLTAARVLVAGGAVAAAALFLFAPRLAAVGVALFLGVSTVVVWSTIRNQSRAVLALSGLTTKAWLGGHPATYLNATAFEQETAERKYFEEWVPVWETEFWNRSFTGVLTLGTADEPAPFFQDHGSLDWGTGAVSGRAAPYVIVDPRFRPVGTLVAASGKLLLYRPSGALRLASATEGVHVDGTTTGLAAYTCWAQCPAHVRVEAEDAHAVVRIGSFAALPGGGGKIADVTSTQPQPPFRIEVRAKPGTHVRFVGA
ncbi:MAG: hypothetical protein ACYDA3_08220 [Gaiellaceae bacterium]